MADLNDLAELTLHHRATAARQFDSEIEKLRHIYGPAVVTKAMQIVERQGVARDAISITDSRARHHAQRAAERRQAAFRR